jgi:hypothetical protein
MVKDSNAQVALRMTALLLTTAGSLMIAIAVLHLHEVEIRDRQFDEKVMNLMKRTKKFSVAGIILLSLSGVLAIVAEVLALEDI